MKTLLAALILFAATVPSAAALGAGMPAFGGEATEAATAGPEPVLLAQQADCSAAASQAAAQTGGEVLSVSSRGSGPDAECVVTVLVPGAEGERPRKETISVRP